MIIYMDFHRKSITTDVKTTQKLLRVQTFCIKYMFHF
jgi:hypothetical protein